VLAIFARLAADEAMPGHERMGRPDSRLRACLLLVMVTVLRLLTWAAVTSHRAFVCAARCRRRHTARASAEGQPGHLSS
jgi:hypothetical protein